MHNPENNVECKIGACPCCGGLGVAAQCGGCNGTGAIYVRTLREAQLAHSSQWERCEVCKGRGYFPITVDLFERLGFGTETEIHELIGRKPVRRAS